MSSSRGNPCGCPYYGGAEEYYGAMVSFLGELTC